MHSPTVVDGSTHTQILDFMGTYLDFDLSYCESGNHTNDRSKLQHRKLQATESGSEIWARLTAIEPQGGLSLQTVCLMDKSLRAFPDFCNLGFQAKKLLIPRLI